MKNNYLRCLSLLTANSKQQTGNLAVVPHNDHHSTQFNFTKMMAIIFVGFLILLSVSKVRAQCTLTGSWTMSPTSCPETGAGSLACSGLINGTPPYTCTISPNAGLYVPNSTTGGTFLFLPADTYTITTTDANGDCGISVEVVTSTFPLMQETFVVTPATCGQANGSSCVTIANGSGNYSYEWTPQLDPFTILSTGSCLSGVAPGTYRMKVTDTTTGCIRIIQTVITNLNMSISTQITNSNCVSPFCDGSASLDVSGTSPYSISWTSGGLANASYSTSTINLTGLCPGTYTGTVTDANGCTANINFTINLEGADIVTNTIVNGVGFYYITGTEVWDPSTFNGQTTIVVNTNVRVLGNGQLTIDGLTVLVTPTNAIRADAGRTITATSSTFDVICGNTWRGFEIQANGLNFNNRASLHLNNCSVRHAETAVSNGIPTYTNFGQNVGANPGGKITCLNSTFEDNIVDVKLWNFQNLTINESNYSAKFDHCVFKLSDLTTSEFQAWGFSQNQILAGGRIRFTNTAPVIFDDCILENLNPAYSNTTATFGIKCGGSRFYWRGEDVGDDWVIGNYTSRISGWRFGIYVTGALAQSAQAAIPYNLIYNTRFQNHQGIVTLNSPPMMVANNRFDLFPSTAYSHTATSDQQVGMHFSNSINCATAPTGQHYYIAHNYFTNAPASSFPRFGLNIFNGGSFQNFVVSNKFENCVTALRYSGVNRQAVQDANAIGAHYECNDFVNNVQDVFLFGSSLGANCGVNDQGVAGQQGWYFQSPDITNIIYDLSAGNNFVQSPNANPNDDVAAGIASGSGLPLHQYKYYTTELIDPLEMTIPGIHLPILREGRNCGNTFWREQLEPFPTGGPREELRAIANEYEIQLLSLLDGGNTLGLKSQVEQINFQNALSTYHELLEQSPALSEEVMIAAIQKEHELPKALLAEILASNPQAAKSADIDDALDARENKLDSYQMQLVKSGIYQSSEVESLRERKSAIYSTIETDISRFGAYAPGDAVLPYLDENVYNEALIKVQVLADQNRVGEAVDVLHGCSEMKGSNIDASGLGTWTEVIELRNIIATNGVPMSEEVENRLNEIWNTDENGYGNFAYGILMTYAGYPAFLQEEFGELRNSRTNIAVVAAETPIFEIWPVPAGDFINIRFDAGEKTNCLLKLINAQGVLIQEVELEPGQQESVLITDGLPIGIYALSLIDSQSGIVISSKTFNKRP